MHKCESTLHGPQECTDERWQCGRCTRWYCSLHVSEADDENLCEACFIEEQRQRVAEIRELNDRFRQTGFGGQVVVTRSVALKGDAFVAAALTAVREFDAFTEDNDPWHEHDFGRFKIDGETLYFKIDYYDTDLKYHSPDAADPKQTTRVLTVMLSEDY